MQRLCSSTATRGMEQLGEEWLVGIKDHTWEVSSL